MKTYIVTHKNGGERRLVEAKGPGSARAYVVKDAFDVREVSGRDLIEASRDLDLEAAGDEPAKDNAEN
ncbi:MAG: hypothetical protein U5K75_10940 [Ahrensia sp.]|nr:hypothetical protein [Ahrensia sp.]